MPERRLPSWLALVLAVAGLALLYGDALRTGFLNDDYLFLEDARSRPLAVSIAERGPLGNWYRPLSRQLYFETLAPVAGGDPLVFHLVNFALFLGGAALLVDLLRAFLPWPGVMAGALFWALLPFQRVNLTWISCSQDLLAFAFALAALARFRRGQPGAAPLYLAALLSKESALPLPLALAAWAWWIDRDAWGRVARRLLPCAAALAAWTVIQALVRAREGATLGVPFTAERLAAAWVHMVQSLLGLEHAPGFAADLWRHGPALLPLLAFMALAPWIRRGGGDPRTLRTVAVFAAIWLAAFGAAATPVVTIWSGYYYTLAAAGGALLVGLALRRMSPPGWVALCAGLLWWHAAGSGARAFSIAERTWGWTSHLTSFYFERSAALTDTLQRQMLRLEPAPPPRTTFFFATLPPSAGFQMGNGALIRTLYRDTTLTSHFYSQFSESTAAGRPVRFLYWNGVALEPLYDRARDPLFQVGTDLLLFDRPLGALHAFERGLALGENPVDHLYWLGWARLWTGDRRGAEAAWKAFGAVDDSVLALAHLGLARHHLLETRDTLQARRHLALAIDHGIGQPVPHAVLGPLLMPARPKYGMLELKVASWLKPDDWLARRDLFIGLVDARLDERARRELAVLDRIHPLASADTALVEARRRLAQRAPDRAGIVRF